MRSILLKSVSTVVALSLLSAATCALNCLPAPVATPISPSGGHPGCSEPAAPETPAPAHSDGCGQHQGSMVAVKTAQELPTVMQTAPWHVAVPSALWLRDLTGAAAVEAPFSVVPVLPVETNRALRI